MSAQTTEAFGRTWRRVWQEDECLRHIDGETVGEAWLRLFNESYPGTSGFPVEDWGDATAHHVGERLVVHCHDGGSIWEPA